MFQTPSLSSRETRVLAWADEHRTTRVSAHQIGEVLGSAVTAHKTLSSLAGKGLLDRVGHGVYVVRPLRAAGGPWAVSAVVAVAHWLDGSTYYVGGRTALTLHRLTTQVYGAIVDVYVPKQRRHRQIAQAHLMYHTLSEPLFSFGVESRTVEGTAVRVSDAERTLIDIVDRPRSLVGSRRAHEIFSAALGRVDVNRLVVYAARWPKSSTRQRLGLLMELAGVPPATLALLAATLGAVRTVAPLHAGEPVHGRVHPLWHVALDAGAP